MVLFKFISFTDNGFQPEKNDLFSSSRKRCSPSSPLYHCARVSRQVCTLVIPGCPGRAQGVNEISVASRAKLDVLSVFAPMPQKTCQERSGVSCSPGSES